MRGTVDDLAEDPAVRARLARFRQETERSCGAAAGASALADLLT
ncbi:MAG TPA: hypothetical protein VHX38_32275 [Pseudonocardiaceae bacterium]|jgi:hypothetical protein|nr:hypothetical protein [Pseudonocardiaceae bacterium]